MAVQFVNTDLCDIIELKNVNQTYHDIAEAVYLGDDIFIMSSNPGQIIKRIQVPQTLSITLGKTMEIKRRPEFVDLVYQIEDVMLRI
jgi:ABC-type nitrate/sulfonate/bicarbonate transport system ATPase subunit